MSEESKSPEAEVIRVAAVQDGQAAVAAAQAQAEENAHAAVDAVQAQVDARRAEAATAVQVEAEARQATAEAETREAAVGAAAGAGAGAGAAVAVSPPLPAAAGEAATPAAVLHWQNQVAAVFSPIDGEILNMKSALDTVLVSMDGLRDEVAGDAIKTVHVEVLHQKLLENVGDRVPASRESGDTRERHVQKSQLTDDTALWKKRPSRKHWVLSGRLPPNIGESAAYLHSFGGEAVKVTAAVAAQLRAISDFDVAAYGPRAEGTVDHLLMVTERLYFLRQALISVLTVGLSGDVAGDRTCISRFAPIDASFASAAAGLYRYTLNSVILLSGSAAQAVMSEMVNDDLRLWVNDLMRFAQQVRPATVPPVSNAVFDAPPILRSLAHVPSARAGATLSSLWKVCTSHETAGTGHPSGTAASPPPGRVRQ